MRCGNPNIAGFRHLNSVNCRCVLPLLAAIGFMGTASSQTPPPIEIDGSSPYRFSVSVDLVVLNATVRDRKGWFVADLTERDFAVSEDGVRQTLRLFRHEDIPVTVGLVVDHSGSMSRKLADVILAATTFVKSSRVDDDMFVVNFNEKVTVELSGINRHTNRPDELARAISSRPTLGETALYDAVFAALQQIETRGGEKNVLIVISDGGDNASSHSLANVLTVAEKSSAIVYAIGIFGEDDSDKNPEVLRRLARVTGGEAFFPGRTSEVVSICERIANDIRNQYTVGYVSSNRSQSGAYHATRMVVRAEGKGRLVARTRSGYITGENAK